MTPPDRLPTFDLTLPGDISTASLPIACVVASPLPRRLVIEDVGINETRIGFIRTLQAMGANIEIEPTGMRGQRAGRQDHRRVRSPASRHRRRRPFLRAEHDRRASHARGTRRPGRGSDRHPRCAGAQGQGHRPHRDHRRHASPVRRPDRRARGRVRDRAVRALEREIVGVAA